MPNKIYMRNGCGYCTAAVRFFEEKKIDVEVLNRDNNDFTQEEFYDEFGVFATYPQIIIWNKKIGGYTDLMSYNDSCMTGGWS